MRSQGRTVSVGNRVGHCTYKEEVDRNLVPAGYLKGSVDLLLKLGATPESASAAQPADVAAGNAAE